MRRDIDPLKLWEYIGWLRKGYDNSPIRGDLRADETEIPSRDNLSKKLNKRGEFISAADIYNDLTDEQKAERMTLNDCIHHGTHRVGGHKLAGKEEIEATIHQGSRRDAKWFSFGANKAHGLRRVPGDTRRAIETILKDEEWSRTPQTEIAKHCGVSRQTVGRVSKTIMSNGQDRPAKRTVTRNNTTYTMNTAPIGKTPPTGQPAEESIEEEVYTFL